MRGSLLSQHPPCNLETTNMSRRTGTKPTSRRIFRRRLFRKKYALPKMQSFSSVLAHTTLFASQSVMRDQQTRYPAANRFSTGELPQSVARAHLSGFGVCVPLPFHFLCPPESSAPPLDINTPAAYNLFALTYLTSTSSTFR
jgi:hypothetical protein